MSNLSVPDPEYPLDHICSVIWDNTLYTFSAGAFQALPLEPGAKWRRLEAGQAVDGGVCVGTTPEDPSRAALWIIGGQASTPDYPGLQKYTYSTGTWEIIHTQPVARDRRWHGAVYLPATDKIVTSSTFTIDASEPYEVRAHDSIAPAVTNPILLRCQNTAVMLFTQPLGKDISAVKAVLVEGDDGSKNLMTFDMSEVPNKVDRMVLAGAGGAPVGISTSRASPKLLGRDLTLEDWPQYNDTNVPEVALVLAGGNPESPLTIFDIRNNAWEDAGLFLASEQQVLSLGSSSASASSTSTSTQASSSASASSSVSLVLSSISSSATRLASTVPSSAVPASATASASETPVVAVGGSSRSSLDSNAILGIVLGSITGFILLLGLILCLIRRKAMQRHNPPHGNLDRSASNAGSEMMAESDFEKQLVMTTNKSRFRGHQPAGSQSSFSSMAILMGQLNQQKPGQKQERSQAPRRSSTSSSFNKGIKGKISHPIPQMRDEAALKTEGQTATRNEKSVASAAHVAGGQPRPVPPPGVAQDDGTRRSSGWNRYWSGGSALNILGYGNQKRTTVGSDASHYSNTHHRVTQDSATVPPLNLSMEGRPQINRVMSGSPTISNYNNANWRHEEMSGKIERPVSAASSGYSSGVPESVRDTYDPLTDKKPWGSERAPSSAYSETFYHPTSLAPSTRQPQPPPVLNDASRRPHMTTPSTSSDMSWLKLGDDNNTGYANSRVRI
ncbi:hypothetical protein SODALDRAFT_339364 [Sodiomyces alkalinus F11]|uniref:Pre-mRNA splicing factor CLF1 n=1 Tax=Sodiomyces alkalinus (strain CBS 110278 / VKM F-3762 / F11) TaxID=1314773 RepID=A0A3N2PZX4_SODAK|nr:hypothetical protein SODALDRAFT_339364 [Sodiomyces alkalinus F11]ROT40064.1 hypothetical protein SODALDRAFT_339364 [Sodiomyces alkalinus F11]